MQYLYGMGKSGHATDRGGRWVAAVLCLVAFALAFWLGRKALYERELVSWSALSAVSHAYDVFHKEGEANLSLIGFVEPPVPALLQLPFAALLPQACISGISAAVVGAAALGLAVASLYGLCAFLGLPIWARVAVALCLLLHPLALSLAASGAPAVILLWALTGALAAFTRWARTDYFRDLLGAALYLCFAILTRYEAVFVVLGLSAYVVWRSVRRTDGSWTRAEGTLLAFIMPIAYVAAVWVVVNWAIMGDPWYFVRHTFADIAGGQMATGTDVWSSVLLAVVLACFFPVFGLLYYAVRSPWRESRPAIWAFVALFAAVGLLPGAFGALPGATYWDKLITLGVLAMVVGPLLMAICLAPQPSRGDASPSSRRPSGGLVLLIVVSAGLMWHLRQTGAGLPVAFRALPSGEIGMSDKGTAEMRAAKQLAALPAEAQVAIAGWPGFAVSLFAGRSAGVEVSNDPYGGPRTMLYRGDWLVLHYGEGKATSRGSLRDVWQARQPVYLQLQRRASVDSWDFYEAVVVPVTTKSGAG